MDFQTPDGIVHSAVVPPILGAGRRFQVMVPISAVTPSTAGPPNKDGNGEQLKEAILRNASNEANNCALKAEVLSSVEPDDLANALTSVTKSQGGDHELGFDWPRFQRAFMISDTRGYGSRWTSRHEFVNDHPLIWRRDQVIKVFRGRVGEAEGFMRKAKQQASIVTNNAGSSASADQVDQASHAVERVASALSRARDNLAKVEVAAASAAVDAAKECARRAEELMATRDVKKDLDVVSRVSKRFEYRPQRASTIDQVQDLASMTRRGVLQINNVLVEAVKQHAKFASDHKGRLQDPTSVKESDRAVEVVKDTQRKLAEHLDKLVAAAEAATATEDEQYVQAKAEASTKRAAEHEAASAKDRSAALARAKAKAAAAAAASLSSGGVRWVTEGEEAEVEVEVENSHPYPESDTDAMRGQLAVAENELARWRSGELKVVPDVIDVEAETMVTAILSSRDLPPAVGSKRPLQEAPAGSSGLAQIVRVKQEMEEDSHQYGEMVGQGMEFNMARGSVFSKLMERFPPGRSEQVPWRAFGEVSIPELVELGLDEDKDLLAASTWQDGLWLTQPDPDAPETGWPVFIAPWAFVKRVISSDVVEYSIREEDEEILLKRVMPAAYRGKPIFEKIVKSADFVRQMRHRYTDKADGLLNYLLAKYTEYERHSDGVGFSGYSVIHKVWHQTEDREMSLNEMLELLISLSGDTSASIGRSRSNRRSR